MTGYRLVRALLVLLVTLAASAPITTSVYANPAGNDVQSRGFVGPKSPESSRVQTKPSVSVKFWAWVQSTQQSLHRKLATAVKRVKNEGAPAAGFALVFLSFIYGVVHAVGPGHGKAVISAYALANERTVRRGTLLAFLASTVQAISAIVLVGILSIALNAAGLRIRSTVGYLETASYVLITLVGFWLLLSQIRKLLPSGHAEPEHGHGEHNHEHHGDDCRHHHLPTPAEFEQGWSLRKAAAIVLAVGIRPCTGAVLVLIFALTHGVFWTGVGATFAMSLGTAITVSFLAALAVGSRQAAVRFASGDSGVWVDRIYLAASLGGSAFIFVLGAILLFASLGPARPF